MMRKKSVDRRLLYDILLGLKTSVMFKKKKKIAHENIKKRASKVALNRPQIFFHKYGPAAQNLFFHIMNMSQDSSVSLPVFYTAQ